ncbi:MAG: protein phosphatase 2C domain-containing protein [Candidatus Neomarinimicrobiota bacterium]
MKYNYSGKTDIGLEREINQDNFGMVDLDWGSIFILSDGFGHKDGGKFASQYAVDTFIKNFSKEKPADIKEFLDISFEEINEYIYFKKVSKYDNAMMGCTIVVLLLSGEKAHVAHIGDSRVYIVRDNQIQKLTKDHSYVQLLIDKGDLTPEKAMFHGKRHVLRKCLGSRMKAKPDYLNMTIMSKDIFLLCCDGVWGFASKQQIKETLLNNAPSEAPVKLIDLVKDNAGSDNITAQVISFT